MLEFKGEGNLPLKIVRILVLAIVSVKEKFNQIFKENAANFLLESIPANQVSIAVHQTPHSAVLVKF